MPDDIEIGATNGRPLVAVLVDADNIARACPALQTTVTDAVSQLRFAAVGAGEIAVARVYASKPLTNEKRIHRLGYDITVAKNIDVILATEAVALLTRKPVIEAIIIASGDRDFLPVARALLDAGRYVVIVAAQRPSGTDLAYSASRFVPLEEIVRGKAMSEILGGRAAIMRTAEDRLDSCFRIFLCHSSADKPAVRSLYRRLRVDGFAPWLDEEDLLPGQDWEHEISAAVRSSGAVVVCLSCGSVTKEGFVQKEIKYALDVAAEKPEGTIFVIPWRLEECVVPARMRQWQWVDGFAEAGYDRLVAALRLRRQTMGWGKPAPTRRTGA
jgi:uncharacterized protein (TIGR00288 family)